MANSVSEKKRERKKGPGKYDAGLPVSNKKQLLGFFIALFSILIILSIVSFSDKDQSLENTKLVDVVKNILNSETRSQNLNTANWLGILGVKISAFFIRETFGYYSVIMPGLFVFFGILLMRKKELTPYIQLSVYMLVIMTLLSAFAGMLKISLGGTAMMGRFSGTSGDYLASVTYHMVGAFAGFLIITGLLITFIFLTSNMSFLKAFARLKEIIADIREKMKTPEEEIVKKKLEKKKKQLITPVEEEEYDNSEDEPLIKETSINRPLDDQIIAPVTKKIILPEEEEKPAKTSKKVMTLKEAIPNELDENGDVKEYIQEDLKNFVLPGLELLHEPDKDELEGISNEELNENGKLLQQKLLHFGVKIENVSATPGPVVTLYELVPAEDVKLSRIESLQDDIALAMKAKGIRMIIPIPGKGTVGIEIPNHKPSTVNVRSVIGSKKFTETKFRLPIAVGKTISGEVFIDDLARMPHLLIAGSTGSGKSVGINTIIASLLYRMQPSELKFILIDPKKIELNQYAKLSHHYLAVSKDTNEKIITTPQNAVLILKSLELEMEKRYEKLANATVRNIADYNKKFDTGTLKDNETVRHSRMPYLICIIDELADLMITAAREVEEPIARLAQLARAVGIHLVLATQRPSVDVITGVIKANFSARIAYLVNSKVDSRTILDMNGAEQLIGLGDMLYLPPGVPKPIRIQNPFITVEEVDKITDFIAAQKGFVKPYELPSVLEKKKNSYLSDDDRDELFEDAARLVIRHQKGSTSMLQRRMKIGYARAARIMDELEAAGIVAPGQGSKEREVLLESEAELESIL